MDNKRFDYIMLKSDCIFNNLNNLTIFNSSFYVAPGAAPSSVDATAMDSATILVQWDEVPCLDQNSDITGYTVQYEFGGQSNSVSITGTDWMAFLTSLQPFTSYAIQVAAVNSNNDTGPLSTPITKHTPAASEFCSIRTHVCMSMLKYEQ